MGRWNFYYGGQLLISGINDKARTEVEDAISGVLSVGNRAWFTGSNPEGPGAFSIYLHPGVAFAFTSSEAAVEATADSIRFGAAAD